jgi:hypothetical protein
MLEQEVRVRAHARDELRDRRRDASALVSQLRRTPAASPARGALDRAYRAVLAECAELEASVSAIDDSLRSAGTTFATRGRRDGEEAGPGGAASAGPDASSEVDQDRARWIETGSRAEGLVGRWEAIRDDRDRD